MSRQLDDTGYDPREVLGPLNEVERKNVPRRLYLEGDVSLLRTGRRVAIVGTRDVSEAGARRTARLARTLVEQGVTVVSGLALGVDTVAHTTAIERGGRTIAVVGNPLDRVFPPENASLQHTIRTKHLLVSQFPAGSPTQRGNFPQRNRTMALIADASVIIEAGETSGTLSQGWEAIRLGRPLFILKSVFDHPDLTWPSEMLRFGARVLERSEDLLEILPPTDARGEAVAF